MIQFDIKDLSSGLVFSVCLDFNEDQSAVDIFTTDKVRIAAIKVSAFSRDGDSIAPGEFCLDIVADPNQSTTISSDWISISSHGG